MDNFWQDFKTGVEALWVIFLGIVGTVAHNWDTIVSRVAALTACILLLHTAWKRFKKREKPVDKPDDGD